MFVMNLNQYLYKCSFVYKQYDKNGGVLDNIATKRPCFKGLINKKLLLLDFILYLTAGDSVHLYNCWLLLLFCGIFFGFFDVSSMLCIGFTEIVFV